MKKSLFPLIVSSLIFNSCGEFEQKNLTEGPTNQNIQGDLGLNAPGDLASINSGTFEVGKMISNIGINIVTPAVAAFKNNVEELDEKTQTYCNVADTQTADELVMEVLRSDLQTSWKKAMNSYHYLEAFKYGPVAFNEEELGLKIYSWPLVNACRVDLEIVKQSPKDEFTLKTNLNTRGLDALEGLLLGDENSHNCPRTNSRLKAWLDKSLAEKRIDRCKYMKLVTADLAQSAKTLEKAWNLRQGHYTLSMIKNKTKQEKIDISKIISQSLFYVEKIVKDTKIGKGKEFCKNLNEHSLDSKMAVSSILENLKGFKNSFNGVNGDTLANGFGYDDYLRNLGFESVAAGINTNTTHAIEVFTQLHESNETITKEEICSKYEDIRGITNILKGEFLLALGKDSAPGQSQGDMD
jgi:predicted lipoprotein